jgi:hypothetical protein
MENKMSDNAHDQMYETANRAARSMIAVVDTMTQRGAFKGEELSTIGQLRDQCIQIIQMAETNEQEKAQAADDGDAS